MSAAGAALNRWKYVEAFSWSHHSRYSLNSLLPEPFYLGNDPSKRWVSPTHFICHSACVFCTCCDLVTIPVIYTARVDVAGVLDPKVPLLVLTASTLDTHLLAVPSPPLSIAGRERSIPPFVLQVRDDSLQ